MHSKVKFFIGKSRNHGNQFYCGIGDGVIDGVYGYGESIEEAFTAFMETLNKRDLYYITYCGQDKKQVITMGDRLRYRNNSKAFYCGIQGLQHFDTLIHNGSTLEKAIMNFVRAYNKSIRFNIEAAASR